MSEHNTYCLGPYKCAQNLQEMSYKSNHHRTISRIVNRYYSGFNLIFKTFISNFDFKYLMLSMWKDRWVLEVDRLAITDDEKSHLRNLMIAHYRQTYRVEKEAIRQARLVKKRLRAEQRLKEKYGDKLRETPAHTSNR